MKQNHSDTYEKAVGAVSGVFGFLIVLLASASFASAADVPLLGEIEMGFNVAFILSIIGVLALVAATAGGRAMVRRIPVGGGFIASGGAALGVIALLIVSVISPGGALHSDGTTASAAGSTSGTTAVATASGTFDPLLHESTSDVTFYAADKHTKAAINPQVKIFKAGAATDKEIFEGSATSEYSATMTSGSVTISGIQVQTLGCKVDVSLDLANYYEDVIRDVGICTSKNALGTNDISVPTFHMEAFGTISLAKTDTSLTCSAGSQCSYSVILRNSVTDKGLRDMAVKFASTVSTLDSADANQACSIVEVSSTKYVVFNSPSNNIGPLGTLTCAVKITRNSGTVAGASYNLTADDHFAKFGASAWNTNSNIRGATATSATEVSFA